MSSTRQTLAVFHAELDPDHLEILHGPELSAAEAVLPPSRNSALHRTIDCSETFSWRAASATDTSPEHTASTIHVVVSGANASGLPASANRNHTPIRPSRPARQNS